MAYHAVLSWQRNLTSSVQIIFTDLQNLKRILKEPGLCTNRDIQVMGTCLPLAGGGVVDDGVLVEVCGATGGTGLVVLG